MNKSKARYNPTERIGINATEAIFLKEFNWAFRELPVCDFGIDAELERVDDNHQKALKNRKKQERVIFKNMMMVWFTEERTFI